MNRKITSLIILMIVLLNSVLSVHAISMDAPNNDDKKNIVNPNNTSFIKINETVAIDSNLDMTLYLDYIDYDNFIFKLYSNNLLEEVKTNDIDLTNYNNEEITFDYCINCSNLKTIVLNYKLPSTVNVGDKITFNVELINKDNQEEYISYRTTVTVIDSIKIEEDKDSTIDNKDKGKTNFPTRSSSMNFSSSTTPSNSNPVSNVSTQYKGSSNNYLSSISVKGYELNKSFAKERLTYFVTVPNNVKSLNIKTTKESSKSTINISGNNNFSVGLNKVLITVTSEDGRVKNYRIYVTRMDSDSNEK